MLGPGSYFPEHSDVTYLVEISVVAVNFFLEIIYNLIFAEPKWWSE